MQITTRENTASRQTTVWRQVLLFALVYFLCAHAGHWLSLDQFPFAHFWFPSGLFVATLLLTERRNWPAFVGAALGVGILFDIQDSQPWTVSLRLSAINCLEALIGAFLVQRFVTVRPTLSTLKEALGFAFFSALLSTTLCALDGTWLLMARENQFAWLEVALLWWSGDMLGVLLLGSFMLAWADRLRKLQSVGIRPLAAIFPQSKGRQIEAVALLVGLLVCAWFIQKNPHGSYTQKYFSLPLLVWAGLRFGPCGATAANLIFAIAITGFLACSPAATQITTATLFERAANLQGFLMVASLCSILIAATIEERQKVSTALLKSNERYQGLFDGTPVPTWEEDFSEVKQYLDELQSGGVTDLVGYLNSHPEVVKHCARMVKIISVNRASLKLLGVENEADLFKTLPEYFEEDSWLVFRDELIALYQGQTNFKTEITVRDVATKSRHILDLHLSLAPVAPQTWSCVMVSFMDITAKKQAELTRETLTRTLAQKNRDLESLLFVTSHDLRTPLVNIQGFSERLAKCCDQLATTTAQCDLPPAIRQQVQTAITEQIPKAKHFIQTSLAKMDRLINSLLHLSRLDRAGMKLEPLDMNRLMRDVVANQAFQVQASGAQITLDPLPPCQADGPLLNQVFSNLLDNALKYKVADRILRVSISGQCQADRSVYCIADNGIGIAPEHQDKIWLTFHRVNPEGPVAGEGLGLSYVRKIIERHNGDIRLESMPGEGARFYVTLPGVPPTHA